uniref:Sodium/hydrogen exchanger n=1 Tax=Amphilophus citrinellus TaxID=61819 RepID=A0A3Q0STZ0_AMPCI
IYACVDGLCVLITLWLCAGVLYAVPAGTFFGPRSLFKPDGPQAYPEQEKSNLPMFTMNYSRIQIPFEIALWMLLASFAKIGFNVYHKITIWVPESCLLISIGLIVGGMMHSVNEEPPAVFTSNIFFLYMLPLIVLDSGYFTPTRPFFENIGTVLFAVVGTLWNSIGIGIFLFATCQIPNLLFSAIISAVDPVAVLNVFEDVSVNEQLYIDMTIVVFGECLFSDAVTVVFYSMFSFVVEMSVVEPVDVVLGVLRFFVVGLGGMGFGILFGFVAIEPLIILMYSYLAYLKAELFAISSVMAIETCALTMKYYVEEKDYKQLLQNRAALNLMIKPVKFSYLSLSGVLVLTLIINPFRTIPFNMKDQFGLAYGGLRGAISFALAFTLPDSTGRKQLFITATLAIILFTVFLQVRELNTKMLINVLLHAATNLEVHTVKQEVKDSSDCETLLQFMKFNNRILRKILIRDSRAESSIVELYKKLELQNAMEILDTVSGDISFDPSNISHRETKKRSTKPHKKLLAADLKNMHEILSKNMYKIREQTVAYTGKHALPNDSQTREILIRQHASFRQSFRSGKLNVFIPFHCKLILSLKFHHTTFAFLFPFNLI